ncbi:MAG: ATP-binding protein, partial [Myxococcota bacterium]
SMLARNGRLDRSILDELVTESMESIQRISAIMKQLTGFSRQRSSGLVEVPLHELLDESVRLARPSMRHRAALMVNAGLVPPVVVDRTAIVGVLVNLLVNAQQAIDRAPPGEHHIRVHLAAPDSRIVLSVEDSGVGVAESEREGIFEAFVTQREHGLGLGLAICREVIVAHGGTIRVEESPLGGAAFVVELPLDTGLQASEVPAVPDWTMPLDVLVLEDETNVRNAIVRLLGPHRVREAATVDQAWGVLQEGVMPDVILCDLMLDGELGASLYDLLLDNEPELAVRTLFVTGGAVTPEAQQFLDQVEPPLLNKPFNAAELRFGIQQLLSMAVTRQSIGS